MILHATENDSAQFINIASRLITSVAASNDWPWIYAVHVDNWFGSRWLGFQGKILGAAGVRSRLATGLALGAAAHGFGTARAASEGDDEGAAAAVAMGAVGMLTALVAPLLVRILLS